MLSDAHQVKVLHERRNMGQVTQTVSLINESQAGLARGATPSQAPKQPLMLHRSHPHGEIRPAKQQLEEGFRDAFVRWTQKNSWIELSLTSTRMMAPP